MTIVEIQYQAFVSLTHSEVTWITLIADPPIMDEFAYRMELNEARKIGKPMNQLERN